MTTEIAQACPDIVPTTRASRRASTVSTNALVERSRAAAAALPRCCDDVGYVYMVEAAGLVKIGRTIDLDRRMVGLQANSPIALTLIALGRGVRFEGMLHSEFDEARQHGEWFTAEVVRGWVERTPTDRCICCSYRAPVHW